MLGAESRHILKRYHFGMLTKPVRQGPAPWPGTRFGQHICQFVFVFGPLGLYSTKSSF